MTTRHGFSTTRIMLDAGAERGGESEGRTEYMRRWIFSTPYFTIRLHCIKQSDYGAPHNHPWNFVTVILKGHYFEELYRPKFDPNSFGVRHDKTVFRRPFVPAFRRTTAIHKVDLLQGKPVWTLCITDGARKHNGIARWGFFTPKGYVPWQVYDPNATEEL